MRRKGFWVTLGVTLLLMVSLSVGAYYGKELVLGKPLVVEHEPLEEKAIPRYLGAFRVDKDVAFIAAHGGKLYTFQHGEVSIYSPGGERFKTFRLAERLHPLDVEVTDTRFYVSDGLTHMVLVFDDRGEFLFRFPLKSAGENPGERKLVIPSGLHLHNNIIYTTDAWDGLVKVFDGEGHFIMEYSKKGEKARLGDLVVTEDGRLAVYNKQGRQIQAFTCTGKYIYDFEDSLDLGKNVYLAIDGLGRVHAVDEDNGRIVVYSNLGYYLFTYGEGEARLPGNIAVEPEKRLIYWLARGEGKVRVWGY